MFVAIAVMFLKTTVMFVAITGMFLGTMLSVLGLCRFVPGNSPGLGIGYRDCFAFSMSSPGPKPQFSGQKNVVFAVPGVRSAPLITISPLIFIFLAALDCAETAAIGRLLGSSGPAAVPACGGGPLKKRGVYKRHGDLGASRAHCFFRAWCLAWLAACSAR